MNQEAQSCFLKTLEEPKGKTMLILISSRPDMLLPTIFSRCQTVKFFGRPALAQEKSDEQNKIMAELLAVISCGLSEKFKYVKSLDFDQNKLGKILEAMQNYFRYLLFLKTGIGEQKEHAVFPKAPQFLQKYSVSKVKEDIKLMEDINSKLTFTNINPKLALEILLINI
jgi:DNA polymerase-3 subunit delta'